ncbi:MAG: arylsulfatase [Firmicutes bacterium]|nr:arylsulfatase [Bacillota bacterium]
MERPNLVLITVDQMRADCLGIDGHPVVETPNLDYMAREGVRFSAAYSAVPSCIAARAAILTGLLQRNHGRTGYQDGVPWNYECTLPGELARSGYHTQGIGKMHFYPPRNLCGFHNVVLHDGYLGYVRRLPGDYSYYDDYTPWLKRHLNADVDFDDHGLDCNSWVARPWHLPEYLHPTNWVVTQSIDFLRRRDPTKPFFMWVSFVRPHAPLDSPQVYFDQYIDQEIPLPPVGDWADKEDRERYGLIPHTLRGIIGEKALHRALAAYYALITHIDHQLGRLFAALAEHGVLDNTFFLFTSDHGELLGDHNLFRKALPYEGSARVPFIMKFPSNWNVPRGILIDKPVELRDIMPTMLDVAGVEPSRQVDGRSLIPLVTGTSNSWREYIHGEHAYGPASNHFMTNGKEKYIWFSQTGREQYFDLERDPQERHDLIGDESLKDRISYWRSILVRELADREEGYSDGFQLIPGKTPRAILSSLCPA